MSILFNQERKVMQDFDSGSKEVNQEDVNKINKLFNPDIDKYGTYRIEITFEHRRSGDDFPRHQDTRAAFFDHRNGDDVRRVRLGESARVTQECAAHIVGSQDVSARIVKSSHDATLSRPLCGQTGA